MFSDVSIIDDSEEPSSPISKRRWPSILNLFANDESDDEYTLPIKPKKQRILTDLQTISYSPVCISLPSIADRINKNIDNNNNNNNNININYDQSTVSEIICELWTVLFTEGKEFLLDEQFLSSNNTINYNHQATLAAYIQQDQPKIEFFLEINEEKSDPLRMGEVPIEVTIGNAVLELVQQVFCFNAIDVFTSSLEDILLNWLSITE